MLGLRIALSVAKGVIDEIGGLLSKLARRSTYSENLADSRAIVSDIDSYDLLDKATILLTPTATSDALVHSVKTYTGDDFLTSTWTSPTGGWSVTADGVSNSGTNGNVRQNIEMTDYLGHRFRLTYTLSNVTYSTTLSVKFGGGSNIPVEGTNGTYTVYLTNDATVDNFQFLTGGDWAGDITNISLVDVSSDFDFDRASSATRINSSGLVQDMQSITDPELVLNGDFEELGDELVTNGDFSSGSTSWSTLGDGITITDRANFNTDDNESLVQEGVLNNGKTYKVVFDILSVDDGSISVWAQTNGYIQTFTTTGTKEVYFTYDGTDGQIRFRGTFGTGFEGSIDNISIKQVDPNDRWSLGTGWSIEDGVAVASNSSANATQETFTIDAAKTYKIDFTISDYGGGTFFITFGGNDNSSNFTANGSYTVYITPTNRVNNIFYLRASGFTGKIDNVSVKDITFSTDVDLARINYDSNGENGHILLEPTSTNVFVYSEDFSNWNGYQATSNTTTAPDGSTIVFLDFEDVRMFPTTTVSNSTEYTSSIYLKANKTADVKIRNVAGQDTIFTLTTEWERYDLTATTSLTSTNSLLIDARFSQGLGASGLEIALWGGQIEALPYATSYIPTLTGSTVTRATETLTGSGNSTLINSTEGVLYAEIAALADDGVNKYISINNGSSGLTDYIFFRYRIDGDFQVKLRSGNTDKVNETFTLSNNLDLNKIAFSYKENEFKIFVNGSQVGTTITSGATSVANTLSNIDFKRYDGASPFYGELKALAVFNEALSDTELENLTS